MPHITNSIQSCNGDPIIRAVRQGGGNVKGLHKKKNKAVTIYKRYENVITNVKIQRIYK